LDPEVIYALAPGASSAWNTKEFHESARINAAGMRDRELTPKAPGEIRLLAVGDSFTYGTGVEAEDAYPKVLERELRDRGYAGSVWNAGVPGWGTDEEFRWVDLHAGDVQPDVVLLGIHASDVRDAIDCPLYDLRDGRLVPLDARKTWIYLQGRALLGAPEW